jgi:hydroxyethylthiazole kinase-like uncharacterized protein yjeF
MEENGMHIVNADQMRELDRATIEKIGIPGIVLMENAGRGTAEYIMRTFSDAGTRRIVVLCGRGNNGGDGFVIARCLHAARAHVCAILLADRASVHGDARVNLEAFEAIGGNIIEIHTEKDLKKIGPELTHATLFVDALLGTGLASEVTGLYRSLIETISAIEHVPVVAVDIPSGIDTSTGHLLGCALRAHSTCTFGLPKYGHMLYPGAAHTGKLHVIDIGIPESLITQAKLQGSVQDYSDFAAVLSNRAEDAHKGDCGHVLLLAGSIGKTGAAVLSARAAMRSGAGLVTVAAPEKAQPQIAAQLLESMSVPLQDNADGLCRGALQDIIDLCANKTVLAMGPGLGDTDAIAAIIRALVTTIQLPMVIDADALNALARDPQVLKQACGPVILTPHPGEMARLTGLSTDQIQSNRVGTTCELANALGVIIVLKGAHSVIAAPDGRHWINTSGNPAMAGAGMGDTLTGMIAGLLAQNTPALAAARLAVFVHGRIADKLVQKCGPAPILASEIIDHISEALKECLA